MYIYITHLGDRDLELLFRRTNPREGHNHRTKGLEWGHNDYMKQ